jgi:hypothetical protein
MRWRSLALGAFFVLGAAFPETRAQDVDQLKPVDPRMPPGDRGAAAVSSATPASGPPAAVTSATARDPYQLEDLTVTDDVPRAASSGKVRSEEFMALPLREPSDLLRLVPGLQTSQHQGGGKADQIFLRGFDCDHGDNFAAFMEGVPMNLVSHAHGQGYADQHGIIPEMVDSAEVWKGPYYAELGDFDTAGAIRYTFRDQLPDDERVLYKQEGGSFDTSRELLALAPYETDSTHTIVAGEAYYSNSFSANPADYLRLNLFAKATEYLADNLQLSWWATILKSSWESPGQVPVQAIQEGFVGRFGSLDPGDEGGRTSRTNTQVQLLWTPDEKDVVQVRIWGCQETLRLFHDFHYYVLSDGLGPLPEGIEEVDQRWLAGGDAKWVHTQKFGDVETKATVGIQTRSDMIDVGLDEQIERYAVDKLVNSHVVESSVSEYAEVEVKPVEGLRVIGGARGDEFDFTVSDLGGALEHVAGNKNDAVPQGKGSIVLGPFKSVDPDAATELFLNVGSGFHSNDARTVVQNPHGVTLPMDIGYEVGTHTHAFDRLDLSLDFFLIDLQQELTYNQDQGVVTPQGPTRRLGVETETKLRIVDEWLWLEEDLAYCEGRYTGGPTPVPGSDVIPQAPRMISRTGIKFKTPIGLEGYVGANLIGRRPLDDGVTYARTQFTVNAMLKWIPSFDWWKDHVDLFCRVENIFNTKWNEAEFINYYQLPGQPAPVTGRTIVPGSPLAIYGGFEVKW